MCWCGAQHATALSTNVTSLTGEYDSLPGDSLEKDGATGEECTW